MTLLKTFPLGVFQLLTYQNAKTHIKYPLLRKKNITKTPKCMQSTLYKLTRLQETCHLGIFERVRHQNAKKKKKILKTPYKGKKKKNSYQKRII